MLLRSLLFQAGMIVAVVLFAPITLLTLPLPPLKRYLFIRNWARFIIRWLRLTCRIDYTVEGREHLPPGPAVVMSKHQSAWETLAFQEIFPPQAWVLKRSLLRLPFFGWALALTQPIAIDRREGRRALGQVLAQGRERLRQGRWVVVFPEGTRMAPGRRGRYNPGGALLAVEAGVPIVPVAHNSGSHWPRNRLRKRPGTIRVVIGPPIDPRGRRPKALAREAEEWIEATMKRIERRDEGGDARGEKNVGAPCRRDERSPRPQPLSRKGRGE